MVRALSPRTTDAVALVPATITAALAFVRDGGDLNPLAPTVLGWWAVASHPDELFEEWADRMRARATLPPVEDGVLVIEKAPDDPFDWYVS